MWDMEKITLMVKSITAIIDELHKEKDHLIIAIDGRCASGKTTLAKELQRYLQCNVIHMDHFFLRPEQRTEERLGIPGENIDHERFLEEVLIPLKDGREFEYRPYQCQTGQLAEPVKIVKKSINIIEGVYSCHSSLWEYYDLRVFLTVEPKEQLRRIVIRDGDEKGEIFRRRWIPLEEQYFSICGIEKKCDYIYRT